MIDAGRTSVLQVAEVAWNSLRELPVRPVLGSRDVIAQAKGVLSERFDITADAALALLKRLAAHSDRSLDEVSRWVVKGAQSALRRPPQDVAPATKTAPARGKDAELKRQLIREATRC
jgi:ANTAR domain